MPNKYGWIKIHRKIMDSDIWQVERFTKGQAWIDLLLLVQSQTTGKFKAGDVHESQNGLAVRWHWTVSQVDAFLTELESLGMIKQKRGNKGTVITISNWSRYQIQEQQKEKSTDTPESPLNSNSTDTQVEIYYDTNGERRRRNVARQQQ